MENLNFHKQKLYSLIVAAVGLISLLLPWITYSFGGFGGGSKNGFGGWGLLTLLGVGAVAVASFMGDKSKEYDAMMKKVALGGFGAMALGGVLYFIRVSSVGQGVVKSGFGVYIAILAGAAGLLLLLGIIKVPDNKKPPTA
jgi:hypothetical protein